MVAASQKYAFLSPPQQEGEIGRLGSYCIRGLIGQGGMGQVFLAKDSRLQRNVALKVMSSRIAASEQARSRFIREARAQAAVHHDNVATIFEVGEENEIPFLAMELLKGHALEQVIRSKAKFEYEQILAIGGQVAQGLGAAHARGIIHRDIKPANIWISKENGRPKILDFGLAALTGPDSLSRKGAVVGTPGYLSPEQARDEPVDERSDIYSLGIVLYEMCCGRIPFKYTTVPMTLIAIATHRAKPLKKFVPEIPESVSDLIERMLSPDPCDRPANAMALAEDLDYVNEGLAFGPLGSSDSISFSFDDVPAQSEMGEIQSLPSVPMQPPAAKKQAATKQAVPLPVAIGVLIALVLVVGVGAFAFLSDSSGPGNTSELSENDSPKSGPKAPTQKNGPGKPKSGAQGKPKTKAGPNQQSGSMQRIALSKKNGADVSIGHGKVPPNGANRSLILYNKNPKPGPVQSVYLKFDMTAWKHPVSEIADADLTLTCRRSPDNKSEIRLYGVPDAILGDWSDVGTQTLTNKNAVRTDELEKYKLLATKQIDNTGGSFNFSAGNNVRLSDPRIAAFVRAEGAANSATLLLIRTTVANKPTVFVAREAGNAFAAQLGLRRK